MAELIITDQNFHQHLIPPSGQRMGMVPRNRAAHPTGFYRAEKAFDLPLIPENEWESRLAAQKAAKAQLSDIRNRGMAGSPIPSRDQNGRGYCWAHSGVSAALLARALNNQPYADLSAYAVACIIKGYADQGGWGSEGLDFIAERGCPTAEFWPQQSTSRSNDKPETWTNAARFKFMEWMDLDHGQMKAQLVTCLLNCIPVISDFNWWSHSVCTIDLVSVSPFQTRIWNSWGDSWSENGTGILEGSKAMPDDAWGTRVMTAADK